MKAEDVSSLLLLREDVGENYENVVRSAAAAVGAESCGLALYDAATGHLIARKPRYDGPEQAVPRYRFDPSPASRRVLDTGEPYVCNDASSDPLYEPSVRERGVRSILTVPVRRGGKILGLLYAVNKPTPFTEEDARTLVALAGAAAVTIENLQLYALEHDRRVLNQSLREVSQAIVAAASDSSALATLLDHMWRVVRYEGAAALIRDGERLRVIASRGGEPEVEISLDAAGTLREALLRHDVVEVPQAPAFLDRLGLPGLRGPMLIAPLTVHAEAVGALVVVFEPGHAPASAESQRVAAFADNAALFLEVGTVIRRERQARARAAALARVTRLAVTSHKPEALLQAAAPEVLEVSEADRAVLYLRRPRTTILQPVSDAGTSPEEAVAVREHTLSFAADPLAALFDGKPVVVPQGPAAAGLSPHVGTSAVLVLPMICRDELLGAVHLANLGRPMNVTTAHVDFLLELAQQLALGVDNARLFTQLSQLASSDDLTGLANRRRFAEAIRNEMARMRRTAKPVALVMVDVDHLKRINDTYGHPAGDAAIRHVAEALKRGRRETDVAARLGGEEFALLLPDTSREGAAHAAERIRADLNGSTVAGVGVVTVSIGVATAPEDAADEKVLLRIADERLYVAKSAGRNQVCSQTLTVGMPVTAASLDASPTRPA
ncbi:MAG TPA: diguanylate cyclase [Vicinamibacteria bacterium]|nr:diguanylate cyclase [Vicinamibacteria bacterium]